MTILASTISRFHEVSKRVKFPKVNLRLTSGDHIQLIWAGKKSRQPGTINITDGGKFGESQWYGRIDLDGTLKLAQQWKYKDPDLCNLIELTLVAFDEEPQIMLADYGQTTGHCALCGQRLDNQQRKSIGYGLVCAKQWQLPTVGHGPKPKTAIGEQLQIAYFEKTK